MKSASKIAELCAAVALSGLNLDHRKPLEIPEFRCASRGADKRRYTQKTILASYLDRRRLMRGGLEFRESGFAINAWGMNL
jgi:hypothetical protein